MNDRRKILIVFGTRPEAIKLAPVIKAINESNKLQGIVCVTAQHRKMLDQVLDIFSIVPDIDLNLMKPNQNLYELTGEIIKGIGNVLEEVKPDMVIVQGDTTTVMAASIASFYSKIPVGHVEAGLRTFQKYSPFPEEMNRRITSVISEYHFAPTKLSRENLIKEGIPDKNIFITGNTAVDAVLEISKRVQEDGEREKFLEMFGYLKEGRRLVLVTGHRRESFGESFKDICYALRDLAEKYSDIDFVYPVHLNPNVQKPAITSLSLWNILHSYIL